MSKYGIRDTHFQHIYADFNWFSKHFPSLLKKCGSQDNSIIWGGAENINQQGGDLILNYCDYQNTGNQGTFIATNNNISSDPLFAGSGSTPYLILGTSPCCDAGLNDYNSTTNDIRGANYSRKISKADGSAGTIDIGAYEYKFSVDLLPVELTSFSATRVDNSVELKWATATEVNNYGFEIEREALPNPSQREGQAHPNPSQREGLFTSQLAGDWEVIGFVNGSGNSNSPKQYNFTDSKISQVYKNSGGLSSVLQYRLKQIDNDGKIEFSKAVEVDVKTLPTEFALFQNYPNPFNPTTMIDYTLPSQTKVRITIHSILGELISTLVDEEKSAGSYHLTFNAANLAAGVYYYRLEAGEFSSTKKLLLLK